MDRRKLQPTLGALREAWDRRARENARHYVATGNPEWSDEEFFQSGELTVSHYILTDLGDICQGKDPKSMRVLEIGCGAARVTRALAQLFGEIHAVDISGEMVEHARQALASFPNAHVYQNNGIDLSVVPELPFDFAFSTIVFQHIPSLAIIESYLREVSRLLRPGGLFKAEVRGGAITPPRNPLRRVARRVRLLLQDRGGSHLASQLWVGVSVSPEAAGHMAEQSGFELRYQDGAGQQSYWLWLFKR
jgi:SAM-dependent methyltransferase